MLNRAAKELIVGKNYNYAKIPMHDQWIYLVVSCMNGIVIYDSSPSLSYRQHSNNVDGVTTWTKRISRLRPWRRRVLVDMASELLRVFGDDMSVTAKRACKDFVEKAGSNSFLERTIYIMNAPVYRQTKLDDFLMRVQVAMGRR